VSINASKLRLLTVASITQFLKRVASFTLFINEIYHPLLLDLEPLKLFENMGILSDKYKEVTTVADAERMENRVGKMREVGGKVVCACVANG